MNYKINYFALIFAFIIERNSYSEINQNRKNFDKLYSFSFKDLACKNSRGKQGYNYRSWGDCTDLSSTHLNSGKNQKKLQWYKRRLIGSNFEKTDLSRTVFRTADLRFTKWNDSILHNVIFLNTDLRGADFRGADLSGVQFQGEANKKYQLSGALLNHQTLFTTLLDNNDQPYTDIKKFGFSHDMIFIDDLGVIEGGFLTHLEWNEATQKGTVQLNLFSKTLQLNLLDARLLSIAQTAITEKNKVKVEISNGFLLSIEPLAK